MSEKSLSRHVARLRRFRGINWRFIVAIILFVSAGLGALLLSRRRMPDPNSAFTVSAPPSPSEIASVERKLKKNPKDEAMLVQAGALYRRSGRLREALTALRRAVQLKPTDAEADRQLSAVFDQAEYYDREIDALNAAIRLDPKDWHSSLRLAELYSRFGWFHEAGPLLLHALTLAPGEPRPYLQEANSEYLLGKFPEMQAWDKKGLKVAPNDPALLASYAESLRASGKLPAAERELKKAISLAPDSQTRARNYRDLAHLYLEANWPQPRTRDAVAAALTALKLNPDDWQSYYWQGRALQNLGRDDEAQRSYEAVAKHDVSFETVSYQLGMIYRRSPNPKVRAEGARLVQLYSDLRSKQRKFDDDLATLSTHPDDAKAHAVMATWYLSQDRLPQAIVELRRILQITPQDSVAARLLAKTLTAVGRLTEARAITTSLATGRTAP